MHAKLPETGSVSQCGCGAMHDVTPHLFPCEHEPWKETAEFFK